MSEPAYSDGEAKKTREPYARLLTLADALVQAAHPITESDRHEIRDGVVELVDKLTVRASLRKPCCPTLEEAVRQGGVFRRGGTWYVTMMGGASITLCPWCGARRA